MSIRFNDRYLESFITKQEYQGILAQVTAADQMLRERSGLGNDFLGWLDLPVNYDKNEFDRIKKAAERIAGDSEILIVIGIGGSYLGARAALELLKTQNYNLHTGGRPQIFFAGNNISSSGLCELLALCENRDFSVNVISKSGTTTEPAIAFRAFRKLLVKKYGADAAKKRIYATTDKKRGTLKTQADQEGYESFVIPDDIGGRYSVLTATGLLPMAVAGIDIGAVMAGAAAARSDFAVCDLDQNPCYRYAATRNLLNRKGRETEILVGFEPELAMMGEWFKQLFGESEGKDNKGIWPCSAIFSTDLHSLGQYIQQGRRNLFETVVWFDTPKAEYCIEAETDDGDGLNYLAGKGVSFVNRMAMEGTMAAHVDGGVPCMLLETDRICEFTYGYLVYFFEKACALSGYLLGVNPFDQPGVEFYKKNMFRLLGKPGFPGTAR